MALLDRKISIEKNATLYPDFANHRVDRDQNELEKQKSGTSDFYSGGRRRSNLDLNSNPIYDLDSRSNTLQRQRSEAKKSETQQQRPDSKPYAEPPPAQRSNSNQLDRQKSQQNLGPTDSKMKNSTYSVDRPPSPRAERRERTPSILKKQPRDDSRDNIVVDRQPSGGKRTKHDNPSYKGYESERRPSMSARDHMERSESTRQIERNTSILKNKHRDEHSESYERTSSTDRQTSILKKLKDEPVVATPPTHRDRRPSVHSSKRELSEPSAEIPRESRPSVVTIRDPDGHTYTPDRKKSTNGPSDQPTAKLKKSVKDGSATYLNYDASRPPKAIERQKTGSMTYIDYDPDGGRKGAHKSGSTTYINYDSDRNTGWSTSRQGSVSYLNYDSDWSQANSTLERGGKRQLSKR